MDALEDRRERYERLLREMEAQRDRLRDLVEKLRAKLRGID